MGRPARISRRIRASVTPSLGLRTTNLGVRETPSRRGFTGVVAGSGVEANEGWWCRVVMGGRGRGGGVGGVEAISPRRSILDQTYCTPFLINLGGEIIFKGGRICNTQSCIQRIIERSQFMCLICIMKRAYM
jgi:hypothetical protein